VAALQVMLCRLQRNTNLTIDGIFGNLTANMVGQAQHQLGRRATGEVDTPTWDALCAATEYCSAFHNDIYDFRHEQLTPDDARNQGWFATGGMSGGVGQAVTDVANLARRPGSLVLLRFYGHGGPGIQGVTGGDNRAHDLQGRAICEVENAGRRRTGYMLHSDESPTGQNVCVVGVEGGGTEYVRRGRFTTESMDGIANQAAIAEQNFMQIRNTLGRLRPCFAPCGSVEMHGCRVGMGSTGRRFLARLAQVWGVPVTGAINQQSFGTETADRYEGPVHTAYPGRGNLRSWSSGLN